MWLRDESCPNVIEQTWGARGPASSPSDLKRKLKDVAINLKEWERAKFGNVSCKIQNLRSSINELHHASPSMVNINNTKILEAELQSLLQKEEIMWKQRSRANWLAEGDKNTTVFHRAVNGRRKRNSIERIKNSNNLWEEDPNAIESIFLDYFQHIFTAEPTTEVGEVLEAISPRVSSHMAEEMSNEFTSDEVIAALNQTHPLKAPGPDGTPALFLSKFWNGLKEDILTVVLGILNHGISPEPINHTYIALIPKTKLPKLQKAFAPLVFVM